MSLTHCTFDVCPSQECLTNINLQAEARQLRFGNRMGYRATIISTTVANVQGIEFVIEQRNWVSLNVLGCKSHKNGQDYNSITNSSYYKFNQCMNEKRWQGMLIIQKSA